MSMVAEQKAVDAGPSHWQRLLMGRNPRHTLFRILIFVVCVFLVTQFVLQPIRVSGTSMMPTYRSGGINFVNLLSYRNSTPQRGDIVCIRVAPRLLYLKRVVGLPGETVAMYHGKVTINGKPYEEPYVKLHGTRSFWPYRLGEEEYFLVGDNRTVSEMGAAIRTNILGKVLY
jgi:signal peptidase I